MFTIAQCYCVCVCMFTVSAVLLCVCVCMFTVSAVLLCVCVYVYYSAVLLCVCVVLYSTCSRPLPLLAPAVVQYTHVTTTKMNHCPPV